MSFEFGPVAACTVLLGLWMTGLTQLPSKLMLYALQTVTLGLLAIWVGKQHGEPALVAAGTAVALLKGVAVPVYLNRVVRRLGCRRDEGLLLAPPLLLFATAGALGALMLLHPFSRQIAPSALPTIGMLFIGMVLMVSRRLAVSQIIGFLVLENGIFFYTIAQPHSMPPVVELGVLMDILAGTMLAGLLTFRIRDSFEHIDVTELKQLRG